MAIYHLSVKPISRKAGRSATAAAAYRSGELVHDLTSDEVFDYTRKRGVEHTDIVLPTAAAERDINWARDRQALWNAVEQAENRSNSRVAREYEIALPHELSKTQRLELVRDFAQEIANRHGVAVDFAIHAPHRTGDTRNHHAHLMATTRTIEATGLGEKVSIEWSDGNRRKAGLEPAKAEIGAIRERWAALTNAKLKELNLDIRVDHRSLAAQGIERAPTSHLGPAVNGMERRGMETEVGARIELEGATRQVEREALAHEQRVTERQAVRERRELVPLAVAVPDEDRADLQRAVEADRRAQLKRMVVAADRRVERREVALKAAEPRQLPLFTRLVSQGRALQQRLVKAYERVKEWVQERFRPGISREEIQAGEAAVRAAVERHRAEEAARRQALEAPRVGREEEVERTAKSPGKVPPKRGRFEGLKLDAAPIRTPERAPDRVPESASKIPDPRRDAARDQVAEALQRSIDRYARAWMEALQMRLKKLPVLEHQKIELERAGERLEKIRPGIVQDLHNSVRYEPQVRAAMMNSRGAERAVALMAGVVNEERIRKDPNRQAERFVKVWNELEVKRQELKRSDNTEERSRAIGRGRELVIELKRRPDLELVLKRRGPELGIDPSSRLARVLDERNLNRAISLSERDLTRNRGLGLGR